MAEASHDPRATILRRVLDGSLPVDAAEQQLRASPRRGDPAVVTLVAGDVRAALTRCLDGSWTPSQLEAWADFIEMRDDVEIPASEQYGLREMLFEIASPPLFEALTPRRVQSLLDRLDELEATFVVTAIGRPWFADRIRAGADWSIVAQHLQQRQLGDAFTWLPPDRTTLVDALDHDVPGVAGLRELAARGLVGLMPGVEAGSVGAVVLEDITGVSGPDGIVPWPADYSAAVGGAALHAADSRDPAAVRDAIACVLAPNESFGVITRLPRPQRFRGWRTERELAAIIATASHAVTFAWDGAGIVVAELGD